MCPYRPCFVGHPPSGVGQSPLLGGGPSRGGVQSWGAGAAWRPESWRATGEGEGPPASLPSPGAVRPTPPTWPQPGCHRRPGVNGTACRGQEPSGQRDGVPSGPGGCAAPGPALKRQGGRVPGSPQPGLRLREGHKAAPSLSLGTSSSLSPGETAARGPGSPVGEVRSGRRATLPRCPSRAVFSTDSLADTLPCSRTDTSV